MDKEIKIDAYARDADGKQQYCGNDGMPLMKNKNREGKEVIHCGRCVFHLGDPHPSLLWDGYDDFIPGGWLECASSSFGNEMGRFHSQMPRSPKTNEVIVSWPDFWKAFAKRFYESCHWLDEAKVEDKKKHDIIPLDLKIHNHFWGMDGRCGGAYLYEGKVCEGRCHGGEPGTFHYTCFHKDKS